MFLEISSLNVSYGDAKALFDIAFYVDKREIVSIVGSNAAGKTTTLNAISGILRPTSGNIKFDGYEIKGLAPDKIVRAGIVQIPEGRQLFPAMTVLENLEMGSYTELARKKRLQTLEWIYGIFPILEKRARQLVRTMSGGEQQMLAIARGLMSLPKLLMFDEPSLGLAPNLVKDVFKIVKEINNQGTTVLLVEQNIYHALNISTRAYVLENGRIILDGTGTDLLDNENVKRAYLGI